MGRYWIACLALLGCGSDSVIESYENEGTVCLRSNPDAGAVIRVVFPACLSSSCSRELSASCTIEVSGDELRLQSAARVEEKRGVGVSCTDDCRFLDATCASPPLAPGEYTVLHGKDSTKVTLPAPQTMLFDAGAPGSCFGP